MSAWEDMRGRFAAEKTAAIRDLLDRCDARAALGIVKLIVTYEGLGDSGETESAVAFNAQEQEVPLPEALASELADVADNLIPFGYENGDGGQGEIVLDVLARKIWHEHSDFYVESDTSSTSYDREFLDQAASEDQAPESP